MISIREELKGLTQTSELEDQAAVRDRRSVRNMDSFEIPVCQDQLAERLRQFYAAWGAANKGDEDIRNICSELAGSASALADFNRKLRARYRGTDLSSRPAEIEDRRQELAQEVSPFSKPITFDHRFCVAPMVGQSDLAFRVLCLRHGASVCWTEMFYSQRIVEDDAYLPGALQSCAEDRPLVVQVCGNDPAIMAAAAVRIEEYCNSSLFGLDAIGKLCASFSSLYLHT